MSDQAGKGDSRRDDFARFQAGGYWRRLEEKQKQQYYEKQKGKDRDGQALCRGGAGVENDR